MTVAHKLCVVHTQNFVECLLPTKSLVAMRVTQTVCVVHTLHTRCCVLLTTKGLTALTATHKRCMLYTLYNVLCCCSLKA